MTRHDTTRHDTTRHDTTRPHNLSRNSELELLRIVAMLMIIASHLAQHGGFDFPITSISVNRLWWQALRISGSRGNAIFVLISGYFLINSSGIKPLKLFNLWLRIFLCSVIVFCALVFSGLEPFSLKEAVKSMMPITHGWWWFPKAYFVLYLIHPYLNILLHSFSKRDYEKFLAAIMIYWSIIPAFLKTDFGANSLTQFICIYSLAGYFRLWASDFGSRKFILYGVLFIIADVIVIAAFNVIGFSIPYFGERALDFAGIMGPFTLSSALCLFLGFRRLDVRLGRVINIMASATFGVYLLHENNFCKRVLWSEGFRMGSFQDSVYLIPYSIAAVFIVYIVCTLIELARIKIFRTLSGGRLS